MDHLLQLLSKACNLFVEDVLSEKHKGLGGLTPLLLLKACNPFVTDALQEIRQPLEHKGLGGSPAPIALERM